MSVQKLLDEGCLDSFDSLDLLMILVQVQYDKAALLSQLIEVDKDKKYYGSDVVWAKYYQLRELRDREKIKAGRLKGLKLSKSETARTYNRQ